MTATLKDATRWRVAMVRHTPRRLSNVEEIFRTPDTLLPRGAARHTDHQVVRWMAATRTPRHAQ